MVALTDPRYYGIDYGRDDRTVMAISMSTGQGKTLAMAMEAIRRGRLTMEELERMPSDVVRQLREMMRRGDIEMVQDNTMTTTFREPRHNPVITRTPKHTFRVQQADEFEPIQMHTVDLQAVCDAIMEHCRELVEYFDTEADFILMGEEEFAAICNTPYAHETFGFTMKTVRNGTLVGIPVRVTPTVTGWCIVPKVRIENT